MYLPDLLCLRNGGRVGGFEIDDIEGAAMAGSNVGESRALSHEHAAVKLRIRGEVLNERMEENEGDRSVERRGVVSTLWKEMSRNSRRSATSGPH